MKIDHILVATDLSAAARFAFAHAAALAQQCEARLTLLHVTDRLELSYLPSHELVTRAEEAALEARRRLERESSYFGDCGRPVTVHVVPGRAAEQIIHFVEGEGVDLCVLARHGQGRARRLLLGSTAKRVLRHIKVPFLLVPAPEADAQTHPPPFTGYRHLLTTTDYGNDSRLGLRMAWELAHHCGARLTLTHVARLPTGVVAAGEGGALHAPNDTLEWITRHHTERLEAEIAQAGAEGTAVHVTLDESSSAGITTAALALQADMIVVPSHGKGAFRAILIGSTSEHTLERSHVPVLVLPRAWLQNTAPPAP
jgi:universal stress protein E